MEDILTARVGKYLLVAAELLELLSRRLSILFILPSRLWNEIKGYQNEPPRHAVDVHEQDTTCSQRTAEIYDAETNTNIVLSNTAFSHRTRYALSAYTPHSKRYFSCSSVGVIPST